MQRQGAIFDYGVLHMEWPTVVFALVVFLITMILLNLLLFKPVVRTIEARAGILNQGNDRLDEIEKAVADAKAQLAAKQASLIEEVSSSYQAAMSDAQKQASSLTEAAKKEAEQKLSDAAQEIDKESTAALDEAKGLAKNLAGMIQTKVLNG